jgi:hypothetical protein
MAAAIAGKDEIIITAKSKWMNVSVLPKKPHRMPYPSGTRRKQEKVYVKDRKRNCWNIWTDRARGILGQPWKSGDDDEHLIFRSSKGHMHE